MKTGVELISDKRAKHQPAGYDLSHDKEHNSGELVMIASVLALHHTDARVIDPTDEWGSNSDPWRLKEKYKSDIIGRLSEAGALIAAEIDRIQSEDLLTSSLSLISHIQQTLADTPNITEQPELMKLCGECVRFLGQVRK